MEILIDVFGSDDGIEIPIYATCDVIDEIDKKLVLVGNKKDIVSVIEKKYKNKSGKIIDKIEIIEADEYITNNDEPVWAIKNKKKSSIVVAYDYMKTHNDSVFISSGNTGAVMAGGLLKLGRIEGIHRPALATILPTIKDKKVILLDSGANPQAREISIIQYAKLGEIYSKYILGIDSPKIALLNIGEEEEKGTPELKQIYQYLKANVPNFIGNIESRYILNGDIDVIVCDGLIGNIALKAIEGTAKTMKNVLSNTFKLNILNMLKGLMVKGLLSNALKKYDYKEHGGAVLLGINKPVIKVHGSSNVSTFEKAIYQADYMLQNNIIEKIRESIVVMDVSNFNKDTID